MSKTYDVVFIGGGIMAAATAYHLLMDQKHLRLAIIEKDPTYTFASSALAFGGVRQQFSTKVNIRLARQSVEFYENFGEIMETKAGKPQIDFRQGGYLFLVSPEKWPIAEENARLQKEEGVEIELLSTNQISDLLPDLNLDGIAGGTTCAREGMLDPYQVLIGYVKKAKELGSVFFHDDVCDIENAKGRATAVTGKSGDAYAGGAIVNAAGPWAGLIGDMAGVEVPVRPFPMDEYACQIHMEMRLSDKYVILPSTVGWYREYETGNTALVSKSNLHTDYSFDFTPDRNFFYDAIWPDLADRIGGFDRLKLIKAWRGLYEMNPHDHNAIIGEHPHLKGFYLINGFSGHGLMQAPAAGRGLAELILYGDYKQLDLNELNLKRIDDGKLVTEKMVI